MLGKLPENPKEYYAHLSNCLIAGEVPSGVGKKRVWNVINLTLDAFEIRLVQKPEILIQPRDRLNGQSLHTTDLIISELNPKYFKRAQRLSREVAVLLSFATVSEVWNFGYTYPAMSPAREIESFSGQIHAFKPVINTRSGQAIRSFLEQTFVAFHALRQKRQLDIAFDYFVLSQLDKPIELRLVITFVLLENLKSTYAHAEGIAFKDGRFRKPNGKPFSFEELLKAMFKSVGMSPQLSRVKDLRNEIIHSGVTQLSMAERIEMYCFAQDIIREYFLRLLGYKGEYYPYSRNRLVSIN